MHPPSKRLLHWVGSAIAILGVAFVMLRLNEYSSELNISRFDGATWVAMLVLAIVYALASLMLAVAWWHLLAAHGAQTARRWAIRTYGISQLAKYVPGNIFHLAGRQAIGMAAGLPAWPLVKSVIWELGLLTGAGVMFGFLALPWILPSFPIPLAMAAFAVAVSLTIVGLERTTGQRFARAFGWQVAFLAVSGLIFVALIGLIEGRSNFNGIALGGAFVVAWLAGLVMPGAPAGMGVRELVLLFLLKGAIQDADLLLAVVLGRIVTVTGDLIFFGAASFLKSGTANASA